MRIGALIFLLGCGSASTPATGDAAPDVAVEAGAPDSGPVRTAECMTQDESLKAALDGARKSPNAILAVKNERCGTSVYVSGSDQTANPDSLWRIGSVTKTFVSAAVIQLIEEGKVGIADPLEKWVPNVPKTAGVTTRMLLGHRSGIFNYTEDSSFFADRTKTWTPRQIVDFATMHDPYFAPDSDFHYSNTNYILLGMIVEAATGMKAGAALHARAIGKAGLEHTFLDGEDVLGGTLARGFNGTKDVTTLGSPTEAWTAGAMVASGGDLADWMWALHGGTKVLDETGHALLTSDPSPLSAGVGYGLGVEMTSASIGGKAGAGLGHDGAIDGYLTMAFYFPDVKTSIGVVVNKVPGDPNAILAAAMGALFP